MQRCLSRIVAPLHSEAGAILIDAFHPQHARARTRRGKSGEAMNDMTGQNDDAMPKHGRCASQFSGPNVSLGLALLGMSAILLLIGCGQERPPLAPRGQAIQLADADIKLARQLIRDYGCVACHTVPGVKGPSSKVGPPLENMALRGYIGGVLPNTPDNLVRWLLDPPAIDPLTAMPNMGMNDGDAKDIAAYLLTLH